MLVASLRPPTVHIRLSDRHAGKAAEAPVPPTGAFLQVDLAHSALKPARLSVKAYLHRKLEILTERDKPQESGFLVAERAIIETARGAGVSIDRRARKRA